AVLALQLRDRLVSGRAGLNADAQVLQVVEARYLRVGLDRDQLVRVEVRRGEVHRLLALVGDRDRRDEQVAVALLERVEDAFPRRVDELDLEAGLRGDGADDVDVEADDLAFLVLRLERRVGGVGAVAVDPRRRGRGARGGCGSLLLAARGERADENGKRADATKGWAGEQGHVIPGMAARAPSAGIVQAR